jgi:hypothetical protein
MIIIATGLILIGGISALVGVKLFRLLLPLIGFIAGIMVGFGGVQAVFGTGAVSTTIAVVMAVIVGAIMALLSFLFFELAIVIISMIVGASLMTYLGVAIGLENAGFILFLLGLTGAIFGFLLSAGSNLSVAFVVFVTSMLGVGYILAGVLLLVGTISLNDLSDGGIIPAVVETVDQSFLWLFVWIAGTIVATNIQTKALAQEFMDNQFEYTVPKK